MFKFIKKVFKKTKSFLSRFFALNISTMIEEIGELALRVVTAVEEKNPHMSNEEKFKEAQKMITHILFHRGYKYTKNAVNIAIEIAVGILKGNK